MILKYLIPVKLSLGILPNDKLLPKYNLHEYMNVVQAPRKGDLRLRQHSSSRTRRSVLEVRCLGKAGAPSLPGTHEENLSDPARGHQLKLEVIAS
ncbi:enhanced ethylene response protein 5-like isoform X3 [Brassica napus]|uniref:enhanced ethylene response protein 5-like isoform X3 n=1 Tax=Brassica napus TaxID=3708 RepID=UPI000BBE4178|nr:enhanced ethylene response protein 5-like isoform X3 [Brassica napus]